jgi:hypothetical protein
VARCAVELLLPLQPLPRAVINDPVEEEEREWLSCITNLTLVSAAAVTRLTVCLLTLSSGVSVRDQAVDKISVGKKHSLSSDTVHAGYGSPFDLSTWFPIASLHLSFLATDFT